MKSLDTLTSTEKMCKKSAIQNKTEHRYNNFDFLRFIAASIVIISHSSALTGQGFELFVLLTNNQDTLGGLAVGVFFVISGYLICGSYLKTQNVLKYFYARILRIFPALIVVLMISVFIVGPLVTEMSLHEYFKHPRTFEYLESIGLYKMHFDLPGVSFSKGVFGTAINGSLWTLSFEFTFYIMVAMLGITKLLKKEPVLFLFILSIFVLIFQTTVLPNADTENFFPYINQARFIKLISQFFAGMVFYLYKDKIVYNIKYLIICCIFFVLSAYYSVGYQLIFCVQGAYIIFYIAFCHRIKLQNFSKYGDFSYGIYIYGFIVQQCVINIFGEEMNNNLNWLISLPIAILCGALSWHLIEKHFLSLKKYWL